MQLKQDSETESCDNQQLESTNDNAQEVFIKFILHGAKPYMCYITLNIHCTFSWSS